MKNTFGQSVLTTVFGESHGEAVGVIIDGLAPGIDVDFDFIAYQLSKRRPSGKTDTPRVENDDFKILSGVFNGKTTGTPIAVVIPNENTKSSDYNYGVARPSHADYTAYQKYHGYEDFRGGGHFSGRVTAALVAGGAIAISALKRLGISIGTHILKCGDVCDTIFENTNIENAVLSLQNKKFPVISSEAEDKITAEILKVAGEKDSIGGYIETAITGVPAGVGEPWFDSVEGVLSHALFSIGGIKGVQFGAGSAFAEMKGSQANDSFRYQNGKVITETNSNGGINGGITNGMPIIFTATVKPTPSIGKAQDTINFLTAENDKIEIKGRHDPAIIRRICVVVDSVCALTLCDLLAQRYGTDVFLNGFN
ncbi:MAG: chorismate synthase [Ruminococcaceae bacterium]|nr:chorismate synthase [Oscillospiraceae bacterium]